MKARPIMEASVRRQDFIGMVGSSVVRPASVAAQQSERVRRVGVLLAAKPKAIVQAKLVSPLFMRLSAAWVGRRNIHFDYRWSGGNLNARDLAAELVQTAFHRVSKRNPWSPMN